MNPHESSGKCYWVLAKNLTNSKFKCLKSSDLNVLNLSKWEYCPFAPDSVEDFVEKRDYGRIEGDQLVLHWILKMTRTEEEVNLISRDIRAFNVKNPKRKSIGPTVFPLKKFKLMNERNIARQMKAQSTVNVEKEKKAHNKKILDTYLKKVNKAVATVNVDQVTNYDINENLGPKGSSNLPHSSKDPLDISSEQYRGADVELAALQEEIRVLREKNEELVEKLDAAMKQYSAERTRRIEMEQKLTTEIEALKSVKEDLMKVSGQLKGLETDGGGDVCHLHPEVPVGMIDIGGGELRSRKEIEDVATEHLKFTARVGALCEIFWPDSLHLVSLSGGKDTKKITSTNIKIMTAILNRMPWLPEDMPKEKKQGNRNKKELHAKEKDSGAHEKEKDSEAHEKEKDSGAEGDQEEEQEGKESKGGERKIKKYEVREQVRRVTFNARAKKFPPKTVGVTQGLEKKAKKRKQQPVGKPSQQNGEVSEVVNKDDTSSEEKKEDGSSSPKQQKVLNESIETTEEVYDFVEREKGSELDVDISEHDSD